MHTFPDSASSSRTRWTATLASLMLASALYGCADDDSNATAADTSTTADSASDPLYAIMYEVFDDVGSNSYLSVLPSLDLKQLDPGRAREYAGGRAYLQTYNGWLFVGQPTSPVVTRYRIGDDGALLEDGTISFANFGLEAGTIDPWSLKFVNPTKAYLFAAKEALHIVWNPTTLAITGSIPAEPSFLRDGWSVEGSPAVVRGNRLYRSIYWTNFETAVYSTDHLLAIYDLDTDRLVETVTENRCPAPGNLVHQDEAGNFYFSNWIWPVAGTLLRGAPKSCILRLNHDSQRFDPNFSLSYAELANGLEGGMFTYLKNGQGLVSIFDHTQLVTDATTDPWEFAGSPTWSIWQVDLNMRAAAPLADIPRNTGAYTPAIFDDHTFLMVPGEGWATTQIYDVKDKRATPQLTIPGWSYAFVKVR